MISIDIDGLDEGTQEEVRALLERVPHFEGTGFDIYVQECLDKVFYETRHSQRTINEWGEHARELALDVVSGGYINTQEFYEEIEAIIEVYLNTQYELDQGGLGELKELTESYANREPTRSSRGYAEYESEHFALTTFEGKIYEYKSRRLGTLNTEEILKELSHETP